MFNNKIMEHIISIIRLIVGRCRYIKISFFKNVQIGKRFYCGRGCFVSRKNKVIIGNNFYMGNYCHLGANAIIGDDVLFGSHVSLVGGDHKIDYLGNIPIRLSGREELKDIIIEVNVLIGHGAIILHGLKLGSGSVIAAGTVVTKDVPPNMIVGGNPGRIIRCRKIYETDPTEHQNW